MPPPIVRFLYANGTVICNFLATLNGTTTLLGGTYYDSAMPYQNPFQQSLGFGIRILHPASASAGLALWSIQTFGKLKPKLCVTTTCRGNRWDRVQPISHDTEEISEAQNR
jgi:hypothetical protein